MNPIEYLIFICTTLFLYHHIILAIEYSAGDSVNRTYTTGASGTESTSVFRSDNVTKDTINNNDLQISTVYDMTEILNDMDLGIDPCQDFQKFACGGYINRTIIPVGFNGWNQFYNNSEAILQDLKDILEDNSTKYESQAEKSVKIFYDSCVDNDGVRERLGVAPMKDYIKLNYGWDLIRNNESSEFTSPFIGISETGQKQIVYPDYNVTRDPNPYFVELSFLFDPKNASRYLLTISPGKQTLPNKDIYEVNATPKNLKLYNAHLDFMKNFAELYLNDTNILLPITTNDSNANPEVLDKTVLLGDKRKMSKRIEKIMGNILEFEAILAKVRPSLKELQSLNDKTYTLMTLKELDENFPFFNWTRFINQLFNTKNISFPINYRARIKIPSYFKNLTNVINQYLNDPDKIRTLHDYIMWHKVQPLILKLSNRYRETYNPVQVANNRSDYEKLPIWKKCLKEFPDYLEYPLSSLYVKKYFKASDKTKVETMVESIKKAYKERILQLDWMDIVTKGKSLEKVDALGYKIGYPEYIVNATELDKLYAGLEIMPDRFYDNFINQQRINEHHAINRFLKPVDKRRWYIPPYNVNAYYLASNNEIVFLAGILRKPFYNSNYPSSISYGAIGSVVAHEITHGFDDNGRKYDKTGNWNQWWTNETINSFVNKTKCFVHQYNNYTLNSYNLNGKQTLGDDLADNGGIAISFQAYNNWVNQEKNRKKYIEESVNIQGNEKHFTDAQLFYIAFAQAFCSKDTPEKIYVQIKTDFHSPSRFRIIGSFSNSQEFADAFNCPPNSPMNPANKCRIW